MELESSVLVLRGPSQSASETSSWIHEADILERDLVEEPFMASSHKSGSHECLMDIYNHETVYGNLHNLKTKAV